MEDALRERVETLERAITDGDHDLSNLSSEAEALDRLEDIEDRFGELETRVAELEAATQALRGYVGNVRSVNESVENRAETALRRVEELESDHSNQPPGNNSKDYAGGEHHRSGSRSRLRDTASNHERPESHHHSTESGQDGTHSSDNVSDFGPHGGCSHTPESEASPKGSRSGSRSNPGARAGTGMTSDGGSSRPETPPPSTTELSGGPSDGGEYRCEECGHRQSGPGRSNSDGTTSTDSPDPIQTDELTQPEEGHGGPLKRVRELL